ncbi:nicotinate (nicotinamide) nucleotide adenylyltransferase [Ramlibacter sp. AN1133]|uniref:nicotinate (nicotinamide) nucleotide adenylyltransferase n=1 Tax=Ramlibacter sp. AN1133 TaxID=3133429 RepID=UPI0030C50B22
MNQPMRRVGMFGGAFDPPHRAHVALARAAVQQLELERLYVLPTGDAWHKSRTLSPAQDRLAMARLAFAALPAVQVDDRELRRTGPTYSVETLRELQAEHPGAQLHLLMGEDQAAGFSRWHAWQEIAALAVLCVAGRGCGEGLAALRALPGVRVEVLRLPQMPESATDIRARLTGNKDVGELVGPAVAGYIESQHLYQNT